MPPYALVGPSVKRGDSASMAELGGEGVRYLTGRRPASCLKDLVAISSAVIRVTAWG